MKQKRILIYALAHPIALVAIAVWLLNDHLLKSMMPGTITGKLSDIAGMIVTPLIVAVFIEGAMPLVVRTRRRFVRTIAGFSVILVAVAFAAAKTTAGGHNLYVTVATLIRSPLHALVGRFHSGGAFGETVVLVQDATDLIALPFGIVSVWLLERCEHPTQQEGAPADKAEKDDVRAPEPRSIPSDA